MGLINEHPSGITNEGELAYVSSAFWGKYYENPHPNWPITTEAYNGLLYFQQGWQAAKEFYKVEI